MEEVMATMSPRSWRVAGILAIVYVVTAFVGSGLEGVTALLGTSADQVRTDYAQAPVARAMAGGYLEMLGALAFLAVAAFLYRAGAGDRPSTGWLRLTGFGAAVLSSTLGSMAAGGAALYGAHHGADAQVVAALNGVRNFGFFLSFLPLGLFTCCVAASALVRGAALPRWIGWIGLPIGVIQFVGAAGAGAGWQNTTLLPWFAWFVVLGVTMIVRRQPVAAAERVLVPMAA
jgi:hypothetical protein